MLDRGNQTWIYALRSTDRRATQKRTTRHGIRGVSAAMQRMLR